ncbi:MAG: D-alanyl-D-alanine carboxypeptidase [Acidobacteria bacterium]|nr:D-alanyl-D-alanine carboxypeptidase [Acidobacteriota bacterium]
MKRLPLLFVLLLSACSQATTNEQPLFPGDNYRAQSPVRMPEALTGLVDRLRGEGRNPQMHGIYVESLDAAEPIAALNENLTFNPASVVKLATTFAALDRLGPQHRFRTDFYATGPINPRTGELEGDLVLRSGGDPSFSIQDARAVGDELRRLGIRRVSGGLIVTGNFTCNENSRADVSAGVFRRQARIAFRQPTRVEDASFLTRSDQLLLTVESDQLINIVQYLNAHSVNAMADVLATHIGGPAGVQRFLTERVGLPRNAVYISYGSGLEVNRLTARDTVRLLRAYFRWLETRRLNPEAVMSVAGIDAGTLRDRFMDGTFAGSVVAKTGTLHSTDDGVAALAGVMYTRDRGPLLFALFNMAEGRRVLHLRQVQDEFLKQLMLECGGPSRLARHDVAAVAYRPQSKLIPAS